MASVGFCNSYDTIKAKLESYITTQNYTFAQLKAVTPAQMQTWLNNNHPNANKEFVWQVFQSIVAEREQARIQTFLAGLLTDIKVHYPNATIKVENKTITIQLEKVNEVNN